MHARSWLAAALVLPALCACTRTTPEQQLRGTVSSLQSGIEARDVGAIRDVLADDFIGPEGLDRAGVLRMAQASFLRHRDIGITIAGPLRVRMLPRHASVGFDAALVGGSGRLFPDTARLYSVETGWRLQDGEWRLTSATWTPAL